MEEQPLPKPESNLKERRMRSQTPRTIKSWQVIGLAFLCFVASFLGSWTLLRTGLVSPDATKTLSENRDVVVAQESQQIAQVAKELGPSAVSITTTQTGSRQDRTFGGGVAQQGAGSGIIISADGYVLTNKHVVPDGAQVVVTLSDGTEYDNVKVIGRDPSNDIAFLKIEGAKDLKAAKIGDSMQLAVGEKVIAIGNALGEFQNSVTTGIISGIGRPIQASGDNGISAENLENLFQTDAAINPGNSGGPLLNLKGEVIGINTALAEDAEGIGFAIPINDAKGLIDSVLAGKGVIKPYLGVRYVTLNNQTAKELGIKTNKGAFVPDSSESVVGGSPADKAGIKSRDIILKVNGNSIDERGTLASLLAMYKPGDEVELTVLRGDKQETIKAKLEAFPQ